MTDRVELTNEDHAFARRVVAAFYGDAFSANYTQVNHHIVSVLGEMIAESRECSEWMEYVPQPGSVPGARPGIKRSLRQVRKIGKALMTSTEKHNFVCVGAVGRNFRTRLEEARMGLVGF